MNFNRAFYRALSIVGVSALVALGMSVAAAQTAGQDTSPAAQSTPKAEEKPEVVKTGPVASTAQFSKDGVVNTVTNDQAPGDEGSVIAAGVVPTTKGNCEVKVSNSSPKNTYVVSYSVVGRDKRGAQMVNQSYSSTLAPKQTVTKTLQCRDYTMQVNLRSAKALKKEQE